MNIGQRQSGGDGETLNPPLHDPDPLDLHPKLGVSLSNLRFISPLHVLDGRPTFLTHEATREYILVISVLWLYEF